MNITLSKIDYPIMHKIINLLSSPSDRIMSSAKTADNIDGANKVKTLPGSELSFLLGDKSEVNENSDLLYNAPLEYIYLLYRL